MGGGKKSSVSLYSSAVIRSTILRLSNIWLAAHLINSGICNYTEIRYFKVEINVSNVKYASKSNYFSLKRPLIDFRRSSAQTFRQCALIKCIKSMLLRWVDCVRYLWPAYTISHSESRCSAFSLYRPVACFLFLY